MKIRSLIIAPSLLKPNVRESESTIFSGFPLQQPADSHVKREQSMCNHGNVTLFHEKCCYLFVTHGATLCIDQAGKAQQSEIVTLQALERDHMNRTQMGFIIYKHSPRCPKTG